MKRVPAMLAVLALAGCGGTKTVTVTNTVTHVRTVTVTTPTTTTAKPASAPCASDELSGTFDVIDGSAGAGQISYRLTLTNTGTAPCFVEGIPQVQLLGTTGSANPTSSSAEPPVVANPPRISLQPNGSATADARFSPDVNGTGDNNTPGGPCQPSSTVLRVTAPGGGSIDAPIQPPTSVCERGSLHFKNFVAASP